MLSKELESESLCLINTVTNIADTSSKVSQLINKRNPSEILDIIDEYESLIRKIDSSLSILPNLIKKMKTDYILEFRRYNEIRNGYMSKIEEKKNRMVQMNTMRNFYDEEKLLNDISLRHSNDIENCESYVIADILIDPIINPNEYSTLSIINKMDLFGDILAVIDSIILNVFDDMEDSIGNSRLTIQKIRNMVNDNEFITNMTSENQTEETIVYIESLRKVVDYSTSFYYFKVKMKKLYQLYLATVSNFEIYDKAVNSYTSLVLESFFGKDNVFEF